MENRSYAAPFVLSLVGGVIIVVFSIFYSVWFGTSLPYWGNIGNWMGGMMSNYHSFMGSYGSSYGYLTTISIVSLISGILVIIGAVMLRFHPQDNLIWGTLIVIFAALSFIGMGGFFIGAILGIIGGALALSYKPTKTKA